AERDLVGGDPEGRAGRRGLRLVVETAPLLGGAARADPLLQDLADEHAEVLAAAGDVLPELGLRFLDVRHGPVLGGGAPQFFGDALPVESVAVLVVGGGHGLEQWAGLAGGGSRVGRACDGVC